MKRILTRLAPSLFVAALLGIFAFAPPTPASAQGTTAKVCTLSGANVYTCTFTISPSVATGPGAWLVQMVPGPGTFASTPVVSTATTGCGNLPVVSAPGSLITAGNFADYDVVVGGGGCAPNAVVVITETVAVTANGQICQAAWVIAGSPAVTSCASVTYVSPGNTPSAEKACTLTAEPNVYLCTFTITPAVAAAPGDAWLVQMVTPGPGTLTSPLPVVSSSTAGCGSGPSLPAVTAGTLVNSQLGIADYDVTVGSAGCSASAVVVISETVTVTASGQLCQTVWINVISPGVTSCAAVELAKSLPVPPTSGTFDRPTSSVGVNPVVWSGGTVAQLSTAVVSAGGRSATVFIGGTAAVLVPTAPPVVNVLFTAAYPTGEVPAGTIVLVVR